MERYFLFLVFLVAACIFSFLSQSTLQAEDKDSNTKITTQVQASELASKLANEKC